MNRREKRALKYGIPNSELQRVSEIGQKSTRVDSQAVPGVLQSAPGSVGIDSNAFKYSSTSQDFFARITEDYIRSDEYGRKEDPRSFLERIRRFFR